MNGSRQIATRFLSKIDRQQTCWLWLGRKNHAGYGLFDVGATTERAHRMAVRIFSGKNLPANRVVDHLCGNRSCVNPGHLEVVSQATNNMRATTSITRLNKLKTKCSRGHDLAGNNLYIVGGKRRMCRKCKNTSSKTWKRKARLKGLPEFNAKIFEEVTGRKP